MPTIFHKSLIFALRLFGLFAALALFTPPLGLPAVLSIAFASTATNATTITNAPALTTATTKAIRSWGCGLQTAPLIFVHIGKTGGGTVVRSLGTLARKHGGFPGNDSNLKYLKHKFPNRCLPNMTYCGKLPGVVRCVASTPLSLAIACPLPTRETEPHCPAAATSCPVVLSSHTFVGSSLGWLPPALLRDWWAQWDPRPFPNRSNLTESAIAALDARADATRRARGLTWSPAYASLPVLRVVIAREPFSWLLSKFFWHKLEGKCDQEDAPWVEDCATKYFMQLCGDDCAPRYASGATLDELEPQAHENLRQAFAVVGLTSELTSSLAMLSTRVGYLADLALVTGNEHSTKSLEKTRCKEVFALNATRTRLAQKYPGLRRLLRLHATAVEVHRFQKAELASCANTSGL